MASQLNAGKRQPVFAGPEFSAGRRQAGPAPEKPLTPPVCDPVPADVHIQSALIRRSVLLPSTPQRDYKLREVATIASVCDLPVGRMAAATLAHPAQAILRRVSLPDVALSASRVAGLNTYPPARQTGAGCDIPNGAGRIMIARLPLERFRRRPNERRRTRLTAPRWPAQFTPGMLLAGGQAPSHRPRALALEDAVAIRPAAAVLTGVGFRAPAH